MGIKRNEAAEPQWCDMDYAMQSKHGVFSREGWNKTVKWKVLLEHAKRTECLCHLMFESTYPSSLFLAGMELLEANLYAYGDLFYWLTGLKANTLDYELFHEALARICFWNMRCYKEQRQIQNTLVEIETLFMDCLKQEPLWDELKESHIWKSDDTLSCIGEAMDAPVAWTDEKAYARHYAFTFVRETYKVTEVDESDLTQRIARIFQLADFFKKLLVACGCGCYYDFAGLLSSFRKSEKAQSRYIQPWKRYFNGTRDSLIENMRHHPDLAPWIDRYVCIEGDRNVIGRLFCEERADGVFFPLKEEKEEDYYNPDNWLNILTIGAVLQEYDEQPESAKIKTEAVQTLLLKLSMYFRDEAAAERFYKAIDGMSDKVIITIVKRFSNAKLLSNTSKDLWKLLHDANLYKAGYTNWNGQLNKQ